MNSEILNQYKTIRDFLDVEIGFAEQMMLSEKEENNNHSIYTGDSLA